MKKLYFAALTALLLAGTSTHASANAPETLVKDGKFFGQMRYRYEHVEQSGNSKNANAHTVRTNVGFETGEYNHLKALIEGQIVQSLGPNRFNSTTNGRTAYPTVLDPDTAELNRLWFSWSGIPQTAIKVGRQNLNLDNQRFLGGVGFRQNDQTFDAVRVTNTSIDKLKLQYAHVRNVNRISGGENAQGNLDSKINIVNASYMFSNLFNLTAYGYWLDFDTLSTRSSKTFGVRATGKHKLSDDWTFIYEAEAATQEDYKNNAANYDENYYHIAPGIKGHGLTLKAGYEVLEGDGTNAFQTPLATLHKFNGWADAFLNTPGAGLEDFYVSASYKIKAQNSVLNGIKLKGVYHDFDSHDSASGDLGDELDLSIGKSFLLPDGGQPFKTLDVMLKYADYDGDSGVVSREKIWLQIGVKF
jgi:hypothetical protein